MLIPVEDTNPLRHIRWPIVTWGLIGLNCAIYGWQVANGPEMGQAVIDLAGLSPGAVLQEEATGLPAMVTLFSYPFLHGSVLHLATNMMFLYIFGDNVEDGLGHLRFLVFYLLCGAAAGLTHVVVDPMAPYPLIGASGAASGLVGAYVVLHPRVWVLAVVFKMLPLRIRAYWFIGLWLLAQVAFITTDLDQGIAWWAHLGGFAAGALLILLMRGSLRFAQAPAAEK